MSFSRVDRDKFLQYLCEHRTDIKSNRRDPNSFWGKCCREFKLKNNFKNRNWLYWTFMNNRKNVKQDYESNQKMDNAQDSIDENLREQVSHDMKYHTNKKGNDCGTQEVSTNLQGDTTSNEHFISYLTETCVDDKIIEGNTNNKETFANFDDSDFPLFCICKMPNDGRPYVQCDKCHDWFHFECINYCDTPTQRDMPYFCPKCETDSPCSLMSNNNVENFQEPNLDINTNEEIAKHQFKDESLTNTSDSDEKSIKIEIPKKFKIYLTPEEYTQVQPTNTKRCLQGEWTTLLNTKFYEHNKACVLRFFYNRIKKPDSRKKKCKFLSVKATCKFDGCSSYTFTRKKVPSTNRKISIKVKRLGKINHSFKDMKMRKTTGSERKQLGEILQNKSTNEWYYESCSQMDNVSIQAGNVTPCKNQVVLHKIASEYRKSGLLHPDPLTEVMILQGLYKETFHEEPSGFIQYFACNPFKIILYTRDQLELFLSINKSKRENVLYFDATGSIFKKIPGQDKRILYYSLVMQNPVAGKSVLPLAEMITNDHHMSEIRHFLSRIIMNLKSISSQYLPNFIVTDFSWALIQSVLSAFNNEDIKKYLQRSVAIIQGQIPVKEITSYTYPYLCAAHMVKNFSQSLKNREKPIREFALFIFGLFQNCSDLKEATCLFKHACILFCTKFQTCNVRNSLTYLRKTIYSQHIEVCADDEMREMEEELNDNQNWKTIRDSSWYFHKFKRIQEETEIKEISSEKENVYFDVNIISILLNKYLYILPLWSGIMKKIILQTSNKLKTNETLRYTNNPVENWFGVIKKDLLVHQQRLRVGDFIKKELTNIKGRLGEVKIYTRKKSIKEETEKWNKRKRNKTGPKYYTQPLCMPEPKPKKGKNTSNKTQILQVTHEPQNPITQDIQFDFSNIPAWGGEGIVNQKIVKLINTCPIDNLVYIFCCLCADRKDIQELLINTNDEVCQTVVQMYQLGEKHSWNAAKILWLKNACKLNFDSNYIDLYGSEEEYFVQHLHFIMCTQSISKCSNPECKKPEICFKSNEINLPAPMGLPKTIQNMFDKWWAGMTTECGRLMHKQNTKHEEPTHCEGTRSVSKRSFVNFNGKPPFLLTQPYYFEKKRKTTAIIMNDIEVARQRYCLYAMTLHKGDHFTAVLHRPNGWYFYDGLHTLLKGPVEKYDSLTKGLNFNYLLYVHLQTQQQKISAGKLIVNLYKSDGIRGFYNGISASVGRQLTYSMTRFAVYETVKKSLVTPEQKNIPFYQKVLLAATGGSIGGFVGTPCDLINVRMQNDVKLPADQRRNYKHVFDGLYQVYRKEGFARLFSGASMASSRGVLVTVGQLACYDQVKQLMLATGYVSDNLALHLGCSTAAGCIATTITMPLDVMKTRLMNSPPGTYSGLMACAKDIAMNGPLGFFKGFVPAFVRLGPHTVFTFVFFEQIRMHFGEDPSK